MRRAARFRPGTTAFLLYINDLPKIISSKSTLLFTDDTSILFTHHNPIDFSINIHKGFEISNRWLTANLLSLNFKKTRYVQFTTKNNMLSCSTSRCGSKTIPSLSQAKSHGLTVDHLLSWRNRTDLLINKFSITEQLCDICLLHHSLECVCNGTR
jgi:hypothetical protein